MTKTSRVTRARLLIGSLYVKPIRAQLDELEKPGVKSTLMYRLFFGGRFSEEEMKRLDGCWLRRKEKK